MITTTHHTNTNALRLCLVASLAAIALTGCDKKDATSGFEVYEAADISGSQHDRLGASVINMARLAARFDPDRDNLTLYRMAAETEEFFDGPAPGSAETVQRTIVRNCKKRPGERGTFPEKFWKKVAQRAGQTKKNVLVAAYTDGDNDDCRPASKQAIRAAAKKLADNPRVVVVAIFGVSPENRASLRDCFDCLGDRLVLCGPSDMTLDPVIRKLDETRRAKK